MSTETTSTVTPAREGQLVIPQRLERLPVTSYQTTIGLIICFSWFLDDLDLGGMTFMLSTLSKEFHLSPIQMGYLGSMSFAGMLLGTLFTGLYADRIGRRSILMWSMCLWGVAGLLCATSWNIQSLFSFRFLLGMGLGMELPAAHAMLPEFFPTKSRGRWVAFMEGLLPLGIITAGLITFFLLPLVGWRWVFVVQAAPAIWLVVVRRNVPESPRWLEAVGRKDEAQKVMSQIEVEVQKRYGKPLPPVQDVILTEKSTSGFRFSELWSKAYAGRTFMLWVLWPALLFSYYGLTTWLGALLVAKGFAVSRSITFVMTITLGGIPGFLAAIYLIEKIGRRAVVIPSIILTAVSAYFYGQADNLTTLYIYGALLQFFTYAMWSAVYAYTPELYPTRMRAGGCGLASSIGRVGALLGPYILGSVLQYHGVSAVFKVAATIFAIAALVVILFGAETKGKILEEISQ
ncbi:MAG: MFS transporter [Candidatus Korobacteraceae bacterium]|jgi:putative MFS transporter